MALSMDDDHRHAPRMWFGFSPAVVLVAAAVLIGGGVTYAKSRPDPFREGVARACAAALEWKEGIDARNRAATDLSEASVFSSQTKIAALRIRELEPLKPTGADVELHARLLRADREILARNTAAQAQFEGYLRREDYRGALAAGFAEVFKPTYQLARDQEAVYRREFGIDHCAD